MAGQRVYLDHHIWRMDEENDFSGAEPAKCTLPLRSSRRADLKTYMVRLI
jgi:hypothetical protein